MTQVLLSVVTALLVIECTRGLEWAARKFISWAVRLTHGQTPRAQTRFIEESGDLDHCRGQSAKFLFALAFVVRGVTDRLFQAAGRSAQPVDAGAGPFYRAAAEALCYALRGVDLRGMSRAHRKEVDRYVTHLRELLRHPAEAFDEQGAAMLLRATAAACKAHIEDRSERSAWSLALATGPHAERLGHCHPAVFGVRRASAHALLQLGHVQYAEKLLHRLNQDEMLAFGADDARTFPTLQLLAWAAARVDRFQKAEAGLRAIEARMTQSLGADLPLLRHVQCKLNWVVGQQMGRVAEAAKGYDGVILNRTRELSPDHGDTLDTRHSMGKMFVLAGDGPRAHAVLLPLLADRRRVERPHHADTLETRKYVELASVLTHPLNAHVRRRAIRELRRVLRIQVRTLGPDHPNTRDTRQRLTTLSKSSEK